MRLYGRQISIAGPHTAVLGCLLGFYLLWIVAVALSAPRVPQNAYATFLSEPYIEDGENKTNVDDNYFLGVRIMIYRLLHSEVSGRFPVVVMDTDNVSKEKQQRLQKDGAKVITVSPIEKEPWMMPNEPRWHHMMTKLKLFDLTEYDKICYMDSDTLIMNQLDIIFDTEAAEEQITLDNDVGRAADEPSLPATYILAAHADSYGYDHPYAHPDYFNAGFLVFRPSRVLYDYYIAVSKIRDRFQSGMMEQDLLNYAHRLYGNMPWKKLWENWNMDHPNEADFQKGVFTFHDKFWEHSKDRNPHFMALWNQHLGEMKSYWRVVEEGKGQLKGPNRWNK